ncbi:MULTISPECIES: hypothetical protein [Sorangium]|nr:MULTISPECIES: hypothetical protein [Sorangium]
MSLPVKFERLVALVRRCPARQIMIHVAPSLTSRIVASGDPSRATC